MDLQHAGWFSFTAYPFGYVPTTLALVVLHTFLCELFPKWINFLQSNVGTSQVQWNVGTPAMNYQLMNYILYHRQTLSIAVHGSTFVLDGLLWMLYFHHLLSDVLWWRYCFIFALCVTQALTYSDLWIRTYIIIVHTVYLAVSVFTTRYIDQYVWSFPIVSCLLIFNAIARVISHIPEPLPIHFFGLSNDAPIERWWTKWAVWKRYIFNFPEFIFVNFLAVLSELQAGFPTRLVGCAWVMIAWAVNGEKLNTGHTDLQILKNTADYIQKHGFIEDRADGIINGADSSADRPVTGKEEKIDKDHPIFKWMDTSPERISFESMIVNRFPKYGHQDKNIMKSVLHHHSKKKQKKQSGRPLTPVAGPTTPTLNICVTPKSAGGKTPKTPVAKTQKAQPASAKSKKK